MNNMHGIIFAYSSNSKLKELVEHRTAASMPFAGRYRAIDFMLSNFVNAGVNDVGIIVQESYQSLLDHLGSGKDWDVSRKRGGLRLLPPFGYAGAKHDAYFRGKMESLFGITSYIQNMRQDYVVLADGDQIVNLPVEDIFNHHLRTGADITCVCSPNIQLVAEDSAYYKFDALNRISDVVVNRPEPGMHQAIHAYVISKVLLLQLVSHCSAHNLYDVSRDVLQAMKDKLHISAYVFSGYCQTIDSIASYFNQSMDVLKSSVRKELFLRSRSIKTKVRDEAPTYYGPGSVIKNSIAADGCYIEGHVENSVLFRGVRIDAGANVSNCVLMQGTHVKANAQLSYVITDKAVIVNENHMLMGHESYPIAISKGARV